MRGAGIGLILPFGMRAAISILAAALACLPNAAFAKSYVTPAMHARVAAGLDDLLKMKFDAAESEFAALEKLNPEHPYAGFGRTSVAWMRYIYENEQSDQSLLKPFEERVRATITTAERWIAKRPDDAEAWMAHGAASGIYGRLLVTRRRYVKGYFTARRAMKSIHKALEIDPDLEDAKLGIGMYDYYTDVYPHFIGALAKLVLGGNRARGIATLREVAAKGRYSKWSAKMLLVEIYNHDPFGAADPKQAVAIMKEVRAAYPESSILHSAELVSLYNAGRFDEAAAGAREFVRRVETGRYLPIEKAKGYGILGHALWAQGKAAEAVDAFTTGAAVELKGALSRWAVWGLIRAGNALETMGKRGAAMDFYARAKNQPDHWGYRKLAVRWLSKPFFENGPPYSMVPSHK